MNEFTFTPDSWEVTSNMKTAFDRDGYLLVRKMLNEAELVKVGAAVEPCGGLQSRSYSRDDGSGRRSRVVLWNKAGSDVMGVLTRTHKIAGTMQQLLGGDEVYHYHSKLMMKDAHTGGKHVWHQDYGYWYNNGCLYPDMGSVFIPLDRCTRQNSCLQVLRGSHRLGRIEHIKVGEQLGADPQRVEEAKKVLDHQYVEMEAGDALFFHSNVLHTSDQNRSDLRRWVFIVAYNKRSNNPYKEHHHPRYTPMTQVPDSMIMECEHKLILEDKDFMKLEDDISIKKS